VLYADSAPVFTEALRMTRIQRLQLKVVAVFMLAATAFSTRDILAYSLEGPRWSSSPTMQLSLGAPGRTLLDGNTNWNYAAAPALDMWNQVIGRIQLGRVLNSVVTPDSGDGLHSMAFSNTVFGQNFGPNTYAVTTYWFSGSTMAEADILFNRAKAWDSYRGPNRYGINGSLIADIRRVALHELGHAIGLDHPDDHGQNVDAIMNSMISDRYTLSADDIAGAQFLYGPRSSLQRNILFQNSSTGERHVWVMNDTVHAATVNLGTFSTQWNIVASADFNGNGQLDIVWQNSSTGQCIVWWMNGTAHVGAASLPTVPAGWDIATASDFNGDGKADLLLQHRYTGQRVIWFMNGTTYMGFVNLGVVGTMWKITGSADFNRDGKTDILWQNNTTGQRAIWLMNGTALIGIANLGIVSTVWNMVGTGDFNRDGKPDIVWQNQMTGGRGIWLMNGTARIGNASFGQDIGTEWNIRNY
jgi:hypothetical protein